MNDVYSATIVEANAYGKPQKGPREVLRFIGATEEATTELARGIADHLTAEEGSVHNFHVEPLPYLRSGPAGESDKLNLIGEARRAYRLG
jgi:hypothetical protein